MKLSKNKLATLLYYNSLLSSWQCFVCLRDNDNNDYSIEEIFNSRETPYECKVIYVRSYFHCSILYSFRTFVKFINTFNLLHSLHRFQIENNPILNNK